jgi:hypothetical protein
VPPVSPEAREGQPGDPPCGSLHMLSPACSSDALACLTVLAAGHFNVQTGCSLSSLISRTADLRCLCRLHTCSCCCRRATQPRLHLCGCKPPPVCQPWSACGARGAGRRPRKGRTAGHGECSKAARAPGDINASDCYQLLVRMSRGAMQAYYPARAWCSKDWVPDQSSVWAQQTGQVPSVVLHVVLTMKCSRSSSSDQVPWMV